MGSGDWLRTNSKSTVEESISISIGRILNNRRFTFNGNLVLPWASGRKFSIGYSVTTSAGNCLTLVYRWRANEVVRIPIRLQTTSTQFGGERWWFTCPLIAHGVACNRRVGKLYLSPAAKYFGCRKCLGLTYRSCKSAHFAERREKFLAKALGFTGSFENFITSQFGIR
jgi:hypothetical protein